MIKPIKLGLVGVGRAGNRMHLNELSGKGIFEIAAVCDLEEDRRRDVAEKYGAKPYQRIEDIVEDEEVEIIDIATRSNDHFVHAMTALQAGKTVLLEKPITMDYKQAKELFAYAETCGKNKLFIRHNRRFEPKFIEVNNLIKEGILGDVYYIKRSETRFDRRCDWQTLSQYGGGQLLNWGPHLIDQALRFCDGDYKRMNSYTRHIAAAGDCEDVVMASFEGVNDRIVEIEISGGAAITQPDYIVYGTRGALVSHGDTYTIRYIDKDYVLPPVKASAHTPSQSGSFSSNDSIPFVEEERTWQTGPLDHIWQYVYDTFREGKEYPIKSEEALKVMEVITEIKRQNGI